MEKRYGFVRAVMTNPPEMPINDETRNEVHIATIAVQLY